MLQKVNKMRFTITLTKIFKVSHKIFNVSRNVEFFSIFLLMKGDFFRTNIIIP
jgi:hypothetical protein